MELRTIRYVVADRVATVTLDRPDRLNAWTARMATEYRWCLGAADVLFSARVVLAEEAEGMGLVNRVLPPDELMPFHVRVRPRHGPRLLAVVIVGLEASALWRLAG